VNLSLRDVAPLEQTGFGSLRRRHRGHGIGPYAPSRREFLRTAMAAGTGVGLAALGVFPLGRSASAQHGAWSIKPNCNDLGYAQDDNCDGCDIPESPLCCCASDGFFDASTCFRKHRPDQCQSGTGYDGWKWMTGACCVVNCNPSCECRTNREWRCSDGYKRNNCDVAFSNTTDKRICRWVTQAGAGCGPCPE
jgi:hypothetical protein